MTDSHCQTGNIIIKRAIATPVTQSNSLRSTKNNQIMNLHKDIYSCNEDITEHNMVIRGKKNGFKRSQLKQTMTVMPLLSLGFALKTIKVKIQDQELFEIERVSRFPNSVFNIQQLNDKGRKFRVASNFSGSKYHMFQEEQLMLTISYENGLCGNQPTRNFSLCFLAPKTAFSSLFNPQNIQDLEMLFELPENNGKIIKFFNEKPVLNEEGQYTMQFGKRHVLPAIQNAILIDHRGKHYMEIVKVDYGLFEVNSRTGVPHEFGIALALASFDFKIAIE